jgi:hypothetical protein
MEAMMALHWEMEMVCGKASCWAAQRAMQRGLGWASLKALMMVRLWVIWRDCLMVMG